MTSLVKFFNSFCTAALNSSWGGNKEAKTLTQKGGELGYQKKDGSAIVTSKPTNQKNTNAILSRASRKAIGSRPVPDVAASNQHHSSRKKSQTRNHSESVSAVDNL
jgi:hypothetical protein